MPLREPLADPGWHYLTASTGFGAVAGRRLWWKDSAVTSRLTGQECPEQTQLMTLPGDHPGQRPNGKHSQISGGLRFLGGPKWGSDGRAWPSQGSSERISIGRIQHPGLLGRTQDLEDGTRTGHRNHGDQGPSSPFMPAPGKVNFPQGPSRRGMGKWVRQT